MENEELSLPPQLLSWDEFPESLKLFMQQNEIPPDAYDIKSLSRFIRVNPFNSVTLEVLTEQLRKESPEVEVQEVGWLPGFYKVDAGVKIASVDAYKNGQIYGIDASSGAVVRALDPQPGDNILDLCCAPGAKLCMISDEMGRTGTITGVDVSLKRLGSCRTLCAKYGISNSRLFLEDACIFGFLAPTENFEDTEDVVPPLKKRKLENQSEASEDTTEGKENSEETKTPENEETDGQTEVSHTQEDGQTESMTAFFDQEDTTPEKKEAEVPRQVKKGTRKRKRKSKKGDLTNLFYSANWKYRSSSKKMYDKILLDAQCTLDASVRHILQFSKLGWKNFDEETEKRTVSLQKDMIYNAFRLLKPGGTLVYSTCSFSHNQNEGVIQWLLDTVFFR
eukprot:TRINITY_DN3292_c0_g1_i1.p1 TRINITY_DN3292_c0_g1~~TRINITY_DN3292_c0_g1_i1.p1  ORF type:complete len:393 (-),score=79.36 TRINITY_DN3292_c0_g1_i1:122-1300(-)